MRRDDRELAFTEFVAARQGHLRRIAYAVCGDWHQADDLVQTALTRLYVAWPRLHKDGAEEAYARRIIVRAAVDESRRPWRRESPGLDGFDHAAPAGVAPVEERDSLMAAMHRLPTMQRKTVLLRHWLGLSVEETADELGVSAGTVKSHTSRALARLNELMADASELKG
jgi:RNA polymerase sigma-70 factor (sigma-E family)